MSNQAETNFLRVLAGAFLFSGPDQKKPIKALSGGERNRVALARMMVEPANTLLLDEPTNHLDPASVDVLTDAMTDFPGTIVFISHDPTFLMRISTRVVEIEEGKARDFHGDYEYYLWKKAQELDSIKEQTEDLRPQPQKGHPATPQSKESPKPTPADTSAQARDRRELSKTQARLEKQVSRTEGEVAGLECDILESRIKERDKELADPALYQDFSKWNELHQEQERWKRDLSRQTTQWEQLAEELESVKKKLTART